MHILLFTQYFPPEVGAPQTRLDAMTRLAVDAGHRVTIVTAMPSYPTDRIFDDYRRRIVAREHQAGREVIRTWSLPSLGAGYRRMLSYGSFAVAGFIGLLRAERPDVLVVESPPLTNALPALVWARVRRVPVVFNVADLWPDAAVAMGGLHPGRLLNAMYALERWAYRKSRLVSTVTDGVANRLVTDKGLSPDKIFMVPNGVDTNQFSPAAGDAEAVRALGFKDHPFLIYAGTMSLAHGMDPLIDAFVESAADESFPHLLLVGAGSERSRLELRVREAGVHNIHFRDPVPPSVLAAILPFAVAGVVTMAEVPINKSTRAAKLFPLMAAGIPVLYAGYGEGAACVVDSNSGLAVQNQPSAIIDAVRALAADPVVSASMGASGRDYVVSRWSWQGIVDVWLSRLTQLVGTSRASSKRPSGP
jgi:glycosyltransferase involved in cell wall biosynthesis